MTNGKGFSPERLRRLAANPFVDKKMLQFVQKRTTVSTSLPATATRAAMPAGKPRFVISEESAKLIAAAIKAMLRG